MQSTRSGRERLFWWMAIALSASVTLPPTVLAVVALTSGATAVVWGVLYRRPLLFGRPVLWVGVPLSLAAIFCLAGTFPIAQKSDIQLEFLKYSIYAAAFFLGLLIIDRKETRQAFVIATILIIFFLFIGTIISSSGRFTINQNWILYPPDQNNSSSILLPIAAIVLSFRPRWLKITLLLLIFIFFVFVESRLGVLTIFALGLAELFVDRRSGIVVLTTAALISGLFSLSNMSPQSTILEVVEQLTPFTEAPAQLELGAPTNTIVQFGTSSDNARLRIYDRALQVSTKVFPNLRGLGDAEVISLLNDPPIDNINVYQHAHNFFLQSFLAYGLLATVSMIVAAVAVVVVAIKFRDWYLILMVALIGTFGIIEALVSDLRVLTILMMLIGSSLAITLQNHSGRRELPPL